VWQITWPRSAEQLASPQSSTAAGEPPLHASAPRGGAAALVINFSGTTNMWKRILAILAMLYAVAAFAAVVDVNKATAAELDSVKGIGPAISSKIIDERKKGSFKDWQDFIARVKGVGEKNAAKFSSEGLTVNGSAFKGAAAMKKEDKKQAKTDDAKPAASAKK
jgi:competence protein ComEA